MAGTETPVATWGSVGVVSLKGLVVRTGGVATWGPNGMDPMDGAAEKSRTTYVPIMSAGGVSKRPATGLLWPRPS